MSRAINLGDTDHEALRKLLGYRAVSKAGLAVNSTTNTYTLTLGGTKQTNDIITVTVVTEAGTVSDSYTVLAGDANLAAVATALELKIEALTGVASSASGAVITITPATTTETRPRPPEFRLIMVCPIMAQPPMPPKRPEATFATPCPQDSRVLFERVSVMSSTSLAVMSDSMRPTSAIASA